MSRVRMLIPASMAAFLLLTGCGDKPSATGHSHGLESEQYEVTSSIEVMPKLLSVYTDNTQASYASVDSLEEILKGLKCYCGCMDEEGKLHDSLYRCFIAERNEDGVKWTDHGAQCGTCLAELEDAKRLNEEGKSFEEIKEFIDNKYKGVTPSI